MSFLKMCKLECSCCHERRSVYIDALLIHALYEFPCPVTGVVQDLALQPFGKDPKIVNSIPVGAVHAHGKV